MMNRERMTSSRITGNSATSLGLSEQLERVLAYPIGCILGLFYPLGWLPGLILFMLERKNRNVQWHAKQSMAVFGPLSILLFLINVFKGILGAIPLIGWLVSLGLGLLGSILFWAMIILAVWLIVMAWFRPNYRLPFIGNLLRY